MTDVVLVLTTVASSGLGDTIARALVEERLAACVNILAPMTSIYRWHGVVERETEQQLVIKSTRDRVPAIEQRIRDLHAYELPELLVLAAVSGSDAYLAWVRAAGDPLR